MTDSTSEAALATSDQRAAFDCLAGGGEMGALMRAKDWAATPLGPVDGWPQSLRSAVSICLGSRFPILIWWGPQLVMLYNDAYRPILGTTKHPQALGQTGRACWPEIWHIIGPMLEETVMAQGQATWSDDQLLVLDRNNYLEECYFTFSYSPIHDESGGVGGVFCAVTETTGRVIGERRLSTLRDLAAHASDARSAEEAGKMAMDTLANNPADLPFALLYLLDASGQQGTLAGAAGLVPGTPASPHQVDLSATGATSSGWPWAEVLQRGQPTMITDVLERFGSLPGGIWPEPSKSALVLPIMAPTESQPIGMLVAGISPRREWDDGYRGFFDLVAGHVATAITNASAYEAERQRAEALAELDRAKTAFFSNVSHEFRTPLTLLLGPIEEILSREQGTLAASDRMELEMAHRNGLRLLKLVNTLLDFSRIEAGRMQASYAPIDLGRYTAELASVFRSAIEHAGLRFQVDCPPLPQPIYVDQEMWEKIVLNLLSNAFKFTFEGEISVALDWGGDHVELRVSDTGTGIPAAELPNLFTRFHRIRGAQARTHEGSGIGLALVQELARLHGGRIDVASTVGQGTLFTVTIPAGVAHLPPERIADRPALVSPAVSGRLFVEEALRWLPTEDFGLGILDFGATDASLTDAGDENSQNLKSKIQNPKSARVLLADDNADLREYLARVLGQQYIVISVADGRAALQAVQTQAPDLVLTDIMMPGLDGIELLRALRANPETATLPVILLSARAGEEARIEGLEVGADDYLIKPFSARELLARVRTHLNMAHLRRTTAERERMLRAEVEVAKAALAKVLVGINDHIAVYDRKWRYVYVNDAAATTLGLTKEELLGQCIWELFPDAVGNLYYQALHQALAEQRNLVQEHYYEPWGRWFENRIYAAPDGVTVFASDITERKAAEAELRASEERFAKAFHASPQPMSITRIEDGGYIDVNESFVRMVGYPRTEIIGRTSLDIGIWTDPAERTKTNEQILRLGGIQNFEHRFHDRHGKLHEIVSSGQLIELGGRLCVLSVIDDVTERKQAEEALRRSEARFRSIFESNMIGIGLWHGDGSIDEANDALLQLLGYTREDLEAHRLRWSNLATPEYRHLDLQAMEESRTRGSCTPYEKEYMRKDGSRVPVIVGGAYFEMGGAQGVFFALDISERKRAADALRASEERFSKAFHASPQPMSITRFNDGAYVDVNNSFAQMLGYERAEILGRTTLETGLWQDPKARQAANELLRSLGGHRDYEHRFRNRHGEWRELQAAAELIELGGQLCILNVAIDITARKQAEEALVRAREQAEQIADRIARLQQVTAALTGAATSQQLAEAVIWQGAQATGATAGMLVELMDDGQNLRVIAAHGYPAAAVESEPVPLSIPTPMSDCIRTGEGIWLGSQQEFTACYPALSQLRGSFGNEATAVIPLTVGERRLGGLAFSFAEPRQFDRQEREFFLVVAQQCAQAFERVRLYEAEQRARAAADVVADRITRLQTITAELAVALTPAQVVEVTLRQGGVALDAAAMSVKVVADDGQWLEDVDTVGDVTPEVQASYQRYPISAATSLAETVRTGDPVWLVSRQGIIDRYPNLAQDVLALGFEAGCALPLALGNRILGGIGIAFTRRVDFSPDEQEFLLTLARQCAQALERARLYELEQRARVELEERVRERTAELERSNRELDQFAYVASHDLKSPLRGIEHLAGFLLQDVGTTLPEDSRRHLSLIQSRIKRMETLLNDLLDYSRAGRHRYAPERLNLAALIRDTVDLLASPPGFVVEVEEPLPVVVGERVPFELIFRNLISNAIKHHHRPDEGIVRIRGREQGDWLEFAVTDNGPGIDPIFHERVFEIFQTLKPRDQVEGSGIGLTVVKKMVETRGGAIWLESIPGQGTTFHFTWPRHLSV